MSELPVKLQEALNSEYPDVDLYTNGWRNAVEDVLERALLHEHDRDYLEYILDVLNGAIAHDA